tara:strand:- start:10 stop:810 length:801 start_codon:yes stop_codon:yes gene_type:complete
MKDIWIGISLLVFASITLNAQELRTHKQDAVHRGEELTLGASYGFAEAARIQLSVLSESKDIGGRSTFHVVGKGVSLGAFNWFFKVKDRYDTFIDTESFVPWVFLRRVKEGGYKLERNIYFDQRKKIAKVKSLKDGSVTSHEMEENAQDLLSAFYYARTLDLQSAELNDEFLIPTFFDQENYNLKIKFIGRDVVKTKLGKVNCLKFRPMLQEGRIFKEKEKMVIWISDDANKVPIRVKTDLLIGSLKLDLKSYSGLKAPINFASKK